MGIKTYTKNMAAGNGNEMSVVVLHKWASPPSSNPSTSDLSFDLECLKVETYLRLAGIPHETEVCSTPSSSPSSVLPCLEAGNGEYTVVGGLGDEIKNDSKVATYRILHHLKHECQNLNEGLSETDRARDVCFSSTKRHSQGSVRIFHLDARGYFYRENATYVWE